MMYDGESELEKGGLKMQVELTKFRIKRGKSELVDEWMDFLNQNMQDALLSLDGEKMFVETIMRDTIGDREYLYWYSIQADDGETNSRAAECVDRKHIEYWNKCIDKAYRPKNLKNEVVMIPNRLKEYMKTLEKEEAVQV